MWRKIMAGDWKPHEKLRMPLEEIEELMKLEGWSRRDLADWLGISPNTVALWWVKTDRHTLPQGPAVRAMTERRRWRLEHPRELEPVAS